MLHKVTKTLGFQIFSYCLQLPHSAIAADSHNLFNPLTQWHLAQLSHCHAKGYQKIDKWFAEMQHYSKKSLCNRNWNKAASILQLVPSTTLKGHATTLPCKGNYFQSCLREMAYRQWELSVPRKTKQGQKLPRQKKKSYVQRKGKLHRLGFIKTVLYRKHDVSMWSHYFGIPWKQQAPCRSRESSQFLWTLQGESSAASSTWHHKERKSTTQNFTLGLDTGGVNNTQKLFLNAILNHCVNEALLPKIFNYYMEILSETAHITC